MVIGWEAGPETTISFTFFTRGAEKSTFSSRSGVTVMFAAAMSAFPPSSRSAMASRRTGRRTTWIFTFPVLYFLLR